MSSPFQTNLRLKSAAVLFIAVGLALAVSVWPGFQALQNLVSDEGTESWMNHYGIGGYFCCLCFLGAILFGGMVLASFGVSFLMDSLRSKHRG